MRLVVVFFLVLSASFSAAVAAPQISERHYILQLLDAIEQSHAIFIRNGEEHSSKEAREHLELKWNKAGNRIATAEQFITYLASKSSITGKPYQMKMPDGKMVSSEQWLKEKLGTLKTPKAKGEK